MPHRQPKKDLVGKLKAGLNKVEDAAKSSATKTSEVTKTYFEKAKIPIKTGMISLRKVEPSKTARLALLGFKDPRLRDLVRVFSKDSVAVPPQGKKFILRAYPVRIVDSLELDSVKSYLKGHAPVVQHKIVICEITTPGGQSFTAYPAIVVPSGIRVESGRCTADLVIWIKHFELSPDTSVAEVVISDIQLDEASFPVVGASHV